MKMGNQILTFEYIKIGKKIFAMKFLFFKKDVDIEKVLVSNMISFGAKNCKYFIGYMHNNHKVKPFYIMLSRTSACVKGYDGETKWLYFLIEDNDLLEKCNTIWDKFRADIKIEFVSELFYNKNVLETKIKSHRNEVTDFYDKKVPMANSTYNCLAVTSLDFALQKDGSYYLHVFLKECKYIVKKVISHINNNLSNFSNSDDSEEE